MDRVNRLHEIRNYFLNLDINMGSVNERYVGTLAEIGFVVHINDKNSYLKLYNNNEQYNENWFIEKLPALKNIIPDSSIHESTDIEGKYSFKLPLNHMPSAENILKILIKARKIMGY
jgi:hypothetical protein